MPKAKEKTKVNWRQLHKIKVHHNRWLIWAIAAAVFACAALVGYIKVTGITFDSQMFFGQTTSSNWATFRHNSIGYSLKYPRTWGVEADDESTLSFVNPADPNEYFSVSVYPISAEKTVKNSLFNTKQQEVVVSGHEGLMISQDKSQAENVIMVKDDNDLYVLRGRGAYFNRIVDSFRWTQKIE